MTSTWRARYLDEQLGHVEAADAEQFAERRRVGRRRIQKRTRHAKRKSLGRRRRADLRRRDEPRRRRGRRRCGLLGAAARGPRGRRRRVGGLEERQVDEQVQVVASQLVHRQLA